MPFNVGFQQPISVKSLNKNSDNRNVKFDSSLVDPVDES
jgi:hypothetical protein